MKKVISTFLMLSLIVTTVFAFPFNTYALTTYRTVTKYHLDLGALHIWGTGTDKYHATWQNGYAYGGSMPSSVTLTFNEDIQSAKAYVLESDTFQWSNYPTYTFNDTEYLEDENSYLNNYSQYVSNNITVNKPIISGKNVTLSYTASLKSRDDFNLSEQLNIPNNAGLNFTFDMLGGEGVVESQYPELHDKLVDGVENGVASNVFGYMFFVPIVIEYQTIEEVTLNLGEFTADLDVPTSAKPGESFNVVDKSAFYDTSEFACTQLTYEVDSGSSKSVTGWKGTGLGESIPQSFPNECSVTYTITTWNKYGDSKTASKTVNITNDHSITINPSLSLPKYTYEGHSEVAMDESTFIVDGVDRSAAYVYAQGLADNSFKADSSTINISRLADIKANCTFGQRGTYDIDLNIRADGGGRATDSKSIEVRKTPYIEDSLTGFQKQNRKQILTATVATYPGKPLSDYSITLKDKKTGESIVLTSANPQQNTSTIKTRTVTMTQDVVNGFAYITVEFLTKTPSYFSTGTNTQDFYYQIDVTDSKGDTDTASNFFAVSPDLPPTAAINMDTAFLRNEGTNVATIKAEDATVATDGDSVDRTWYYGARTSPSLFTNVSTMDGYKKLSFGTDKVVGFNRTGVGPLTVKLVVKELWTEPTLEEYVTDAEHLTGSAVAYTDVQNVAPVVSLELLNSTGQEILLLANNDTEYQALLNNKTSLQLELMKNQIDGQIIIKKLLGNTPDSVTSVSKQRALTYQYGPTVLSGSTLASGVEESNLLAVDSENTYFLTYTWMNGSATTPETIHAINTYTGDVWSYTTSRNEDFVFGQDDTNKYLYLIYKNSNQTVLLDKRTGTVAGTINTLLSNNVWISENLFFIVDDSNELCAIDQNSLIKNILASDVSAVSRVGGSLQFITKSASGVVRNILDMETLDTQSQMLISIPFKTASPDDYTALCIDSKGKVVVFKSAGAGTNTFNGFMAYDVHNELLKTISVTCESGSKTLYSALDENGECNYATIWYYYSPSSPNRNYFYSANLKTGTLASFYKSTDAYNNAHSSYAGGFESNGTAYFMFDGWYEYPGGTDYFGNHYTFSVSGSSAGMNVNGPGGVSSVDENIQISDRSIASFWGNNSPSNGTFDLSITAIPRTLAQEMAEIVSRFTSKLTFVGNINTTADQIKSVAETPKAAIKITASQDGYLMMSNQALEQDKKYYYEYAIKPITEGTSEKLNGISASTGTTSSTQAFLYDTYYVENTYVEDFSDRRTNKFFSLGSPGLWTGRGVFGSNCYDDDIEVGNASLTFTVPAGKKAILSYDYKIMTSGDDDIDACVYVDGKREYINYPSSETDVWDHCTHINILSEGTHTVSCQGAEWYVWIDNLKVEILSTTKPTSASTFNTQNGEDEGWLDCNGSFKTPNENISYGSQASSFYSGGVACTITRTYKNGAPREIIYYQTVPSGYIQRCYVYPVGSCGTKDQLGFTIDGLYFRMGYRGDIGSGQKMYVSEKTEGTYTYTAAADGITTSATIPRFDLITYPSNEVTQTGDISFNDSFTEYFFPKTSSTGLTNLSIYLPKGEYLLKNFKIYYLEDGKKMYLQNEDCQEVSDISNWTLSTGLSASIVTPTEEKTDDEYVKIYKKGEKVLYNIFYSDYEEDPSKTGYWVYSHINWPPDTVHPDAGKVLTKPIDRFYLSGKYTVTHWEVDNTQRTGTVGDSSGYNKESNKVTMTFYVDGEGEAPWVTYIKTNPSTVKENDSYTVRVGVDDEEKDTLELTTEVYLNGKLIKTETKTSLAADLDGNYPEQTISGLPNAAVGVYQVVCTVSDYSGTGIKSYKYTVVSEGKITGYVNHTDQWNINRQKYNLAKSGTTDSPRAYNVFWSGERFVLRSDVVGSPTSVTARILGHSYSTAMQRTGSKNSSGETIYAGEIWDEDMIDKWGNDSPVTLIFRFTATYSSGTTKTNDVEVIVDSEDSYFKLHRIF